MIRTIFCAAALAAFFATGALADDSSGAAKVTVVYDHRLPNAPGKRMRAVLVEYRPGGSSPPHTHAKSAFIFATVLEGAIRSQVNNGPVIAYRAGDNWSELPAIIMASAEIPAPPSPLGCSRCLSSTRTTPT